MAQKIEALVDGGEASAGPPLGPALGPAGVNVMMVVKAINEKTAAFKGMKVPVTVHVADDKSFTITVGTPPTSALLLKMVGVEKGSGQPNANKIGDLPLDKVVQVAAQKADDLLGKSVRSRTKEVLGTANSMGLLVNGKDPRLVQREIDTGEHDAKFK